MPVAALICCVVLHTVRDSKAAQVNVQHSLIGELLLYEFELGHYSEEGRKIICYGKDESAVDQSKVSRWLKKYCPACKNFPHQARSSRPKSVESKTMFQDIEANPASCNQILNELKHSFFYLSKILF